MPHPETESIRVALQQAWRDHHHTRDQTWRAVQVEVALAAGMLTADLQIGSLLVTIPAGILVIFACTLGIGLSRHHRQVMIQKFKHITNCERALGLLRPELICDVLKPEPFRPGDEFGPRANNADLFLLRAHWLIMAFALILITTRLVASLWIVSLAARLTGG